MYVYLLQSTPQPQRRYIGITSNLNQRLKDHNADKSPHTRKYAPWKLVVAVFFADTSKAHAFVSPGRLKPARGGRVKTGQFETCLYLSSS